MTCENGMNEGMTINKEPQLGKEIEEISRIVTEVSEAIGNLEQKLSNVLTRTLDIIQRLEA